MKNNFSITGIFTIEQKIYELGKREKKWVKTLDSAL